MNSDEDDEKPQNEPGTSSDAQTTVPVLRLHQGPAANSQGPATKICTQVKTTTREKERTRALLRMKNILANITPIQSLQKMRFKMPLTDSIKEKQKTAVEYEPNSSKTVVTTRKKNQDNLQRNCAEGWRHTKKLAKDPNTGHLQKRWQGRCR